MEKYIMILAVLADLLIGGVRGKYHPVMLMRSMIDRLMEWMYNENDSQAVHRSRGMLFAGIIVTVVFIGVLAAVIALHEAGPWYLLIGGTIIVMCMISPHCLAESVNEIRECIVKDDILRARELIGRDADCDTDKMGAQEITRVTIEMAARNIVSKAVAPLFYCFIGGISFMAVYCTVNMIYSILCSKDEKYYYFGLLIAKTNDIFHFIPARLTAILIIISAYILQYDGRKASEVARRDARSHCDINDGYPIAAVAGALRIRLGGTSFYGGEPYYHEHMGDAVERLAPHHIDKAMRLLYMATILFCLLATSLKMAKQMGGLF